MKNYQKLIQRLSEDVLPHPLVKDTKFASQLGHLLEDMKGIDQYTADYNAQQLQQVQQLHSILGKIYRDYRAQQTIPPETIDDVNTSINNFIRFFKEKYDFVQDNQLLRRLYKKFGCDILHGRRITIKGSFDVKGPGIIISTHESPFDAFFIQAVISEHIFWVGDAIVGEKDQKVRIHRKPGINWFNNAIGTIETDRRGNTFAESQSIFHKALEVVRKNGLVGIFPEGAPKHDVKYWDNSYMNYGFVTLVEYINTKLDSNITVYPISVKGGDVGEGKSKFNSLFSEPLVITLGKPFPLKNIVRDKRQWNMSVEEKQAYARKIIEYLYEMRSNS